MTTTCFLTNNSRDSFQKSNVRGKNEFTHDPLNGYDVTSPSLLLISCLHFFKASHCVSWKTGYGFNRSLLSILLRRRGKTTKTSFLFVTWHLVGLWIMKWQHWVFVLGNCALILPHQLANCLAVKNRNIDYCDYILRDGGAKACKVKRELLWKSESWLLHEKTGGEGLFAHSNTPDVNKDLNRNWTSLKGTNVWFLIAYMYLLSQMG